MRSIIKNEYTVATLKQGNYCMEDGKFCEGCPLANGVVKTDKIVTYGYQAVVPNPGFDLAFVEDGDFSRETNRIHVIPSDAGFDSSWAQGTAETVVNRVRTCEEPIETPRRRLGGILGTQIVSRCGAFPDQKPTKVRVVARDTGWFHFEDFID